MKTITLATILTFTAATLGGPFPAQGVRPDVVREWAAEVVAVQGHLNPANALGPVDGAIAKGWPAGGQLTVRFQYGIQDKPGPDFAVWENGFVVTDPNFPDGGVFAELAFVDVSSNGLDWTTFPSVYLQEPNTLDDPTPNIDPTNVYNLAGNYVALYVPNDQRQGTPFDLADLAQRPEVLDGRVDLDRIRYVRMRDIIGAGQGGNAYDEATWFGYEKNHLIYDGQAFAGGADWDAIGAIHSRQLTADFNHSGRVDPNDLHTLHNAWLSQPGQPNWRPRCDISIPPDGIINLRDLAVLNQQWLKEQD